MSSGLHRHAFLQRGFRPFFLVGAIQSAAVIAIWYAMVLHGAQWPLLGLAPVTWHGHAMTFGFTGAIVAGFLLTAMNNWTKVPTATGHALLLMLLCWALARIIPLWGGREWLIWAAFFDLSFWALVCGDLLRVIVRSKCWNQLAIWSKVILLALANGCFYLGHAWQDPDLIRWGLYGGFFLILGLILMMARRLIPMFIQRGLKLAEEPTNRPWLDRLSMVLFLAFFVMDVFLRQTDEAAVIALVLFVMHAWRMAGWHRPGIWRMPLLWVLYLAYASMVLGFGLYAASAISQLPLSLALHAFAYGGMGLIVLGMMSRISLGHTGRDVYHPPAGLPLIFVVLVAGTLARVVLPLTGIGSYPMWLEIAMIAWILAFAAYSVLYGPILFHARVDGKSG